MPSNPTTLAELVSALEAESCAALQRAITYRTYGTSNSASDYEAFKADLMERAAKVLRAVHAIHKPYGIYECGHDHELDEPGVGDGGEAGLSCSKLYDICASCCVGCAERCATEHEHGPNDPICTTAKALAGVFGA